MTEHGPSCEGCQILALLTERDRLRVELDRVRDMLDALARARTIRSFEPFRDKRLRRRNDLRSWQRDFDRLLSQPERRR